jgi:hypothetical protein
MYLALTMGDKGIKILVVFAHDLALGLPLLHLLLHRVNLVLVERGQDILHQG